MHSTYLKTFEKGFVLPQVEGKKKSLLLKRPTYII